MLKSEPNQGLIECVYVENQIYTLEENSDIIYGSR